MVPRSRLLLSRLRRDGRGTAIVETAIVLPVIVLLMFGIVELGRALQQHHALTKSVRDAARYIARVPLACPAAGDPNWAAVKTAAQTLAATGRLSGGTPLVEGWTAAHFDIADPACVDWSGRAVQVITVSAEIPYLDLGFLNVIGLEPFNLAAQHQQVHIGE
jgi:hypothetical protein